MPSPTTSRGLLGYFTRSTYLPATDQRASPLTVRSPTYLYLRAILAARAGVRGTQGGASGRSSPRDVRGGSGRAGGSNRDIEGATSDNTGAAKRTMAETTTTAAQATERKGIHAGKQRRIRGVVPRGRNRQGR